MNSIQEARISQSIDSTEAALKRLIAIQGADDGMFVLSVHSFMEAWAREHVSLDDPEADSFHQYMNAFREYLIQRSSGKWIQGLDILQQIKNQHQLTNGVRHCFRKMSREEATASVHHLDRFCALASIASPCIQELKKGLAEWEDRRSRGELLALVRKQDADLVRKAEENDALNAKLAAYERDSREEEHLREEIRLRDRRIEELARIKDAKDSRLDELRLERNELKKQLREVKERSPQHEEARKYIDLILRATVITRTRADYERTVVRLSAEQRKVLEQIHLDKDFVIKGAAGTGKTLVLLKALEKALGRGGGLGGQAELGLPLPPGTFALLTYTKTLVKYDRFLAGIMNGTGESPAGSIATVDSFLSDRMRDCLPGFRIDWDGKKMPSLAEKYPCTDMSAAELVSEVENFIIANDISSEQYIDKVIDRAGMKKRIPKEQRLQVWNSWAMMSKEMNQSRTLSRNYAAWNFVHVPDDAIPDEVKVDYVFLDEAQDLPAIVIKAIKRFARKCIILAGDADQSIFQPGFSFKAAGLDIGGRSRILRMNFRNTIAIHALAESYRKLNAGADLETQPEAYREGLPPELFQEESGARAAECLVKRVKLYTETLGYELDNVCILVPDKRDISYLQELLRAEDISSASVKEESFDFSASKGAVRICTYQSAKGLDFPVVLLYLPRQPFVGSNYDEATTRKMAANLIYVGITRAMDILNVFTVKEPTATVIKTLVEAMGRPLAEEIERLTAAKIGEVSAGPNPTQNSHWPEDGGKAKTVVVKVKKAGHGLPPFNLEEAEKKLEELRVRIMEETGCALAECILRSNCMKTILSKKITEEDEFQRIIGCQFSTEGLARQVEYIPMILDITKRLPP